MFLKAHNSKASNPTVRVTLHFPVAFNPPSIALPSYKTLEVKVQRLCLVLSLHPQAGAPASAVPSFPRVQHSHPSAARGAPRAGGRFVPRGPRFPSLFPAHRPRFLFCRGPRELPPRHGSPQHGALQLRGGHINGTQVCTHQAGSPNKGSGRAALQSRRLLPLWTWICSGMLLLVQDCSFHTPSRARPCVLAGVDARPVQLLYKNKVFLLPGC